MLKSRHSLPFTAHPTGSGPFPKIVAAPIDREWISATDRRFAQRCLPLLLANQAGWWILNPVAFQVVWTGGAGSDALTLSPLGDTAPSAVTSHFGYGILTFSIPFLFRTPPGYNLLVRGPANQPKDGIHPLEGLIETDWSAAPFTANWKVTRPFEPIRFAAGDPICMIVPQRRGELDEFSTAVAALETEDGLPGRYDAWGESRSAFLTELRSGRDRTGWQRHYFRGQDVDGARPVTDHQTRMRLAPFTHPDEDHPDPTTTRTE